MSSHDDVRMDLGGYVLGGLEPDEVTAVEDHLAGCGACRAELAELAPLPELLALATAAGPSAPADLRQRVLERPRRRLRWTGAVAAAVVAALALLLGGVAVIGRGTPPDAVVALHGDGPATIAGSAELEQVDAGVRLDLELTGVRPAEEGYYHAWLEGDGWRASAGTFVGPRDGSLRAQLLCGGRLEDYRHVTVTWHGADGGDEIVAARAELTANVTDAAAPARGG